MFNNQQNNSGDNAPSVNTRSMTFKNKDGFQPSALVLSYWNDCLTVKIHPALEENKRSEKSFYDYDNFVSTTLTTEKATALKDQINEKILPAIKNDEEKNISITIGEDSCIVVSTGKKITGSIRPLVAICKKIDPKTMKPEVMSLYEFNTIPVFENYDFNEGKIGKSESVSTQLNLFIEFLNGSLFNLNAAIHSQRVVNRALNEKIVNGINKLTGDDNKFGGGGFKSNKSHVFNSNSSSSNDNITPEQIDNMDDISAFM